jgi:hypothetical protein
MRAEKTAWATANGIWQSGLRFGVIPGGNQQIRENAATRYRSNLGPPPPESIEVLNGAALRKFTERTQFSFEDFRESRLVSKIPGKSTL